MFIDPPSGSGYPLCKRKEGRKPGTQTPGVFRLSRSVSLMTKTPKVCLVIFLAAAAWSQTTGSGTITGTVRDPNAAAVPDAAVTVHNSDTGIDRSLQTNEVGLYSAPFLPPGNYEVTVAKAGFTKLVRKDVTLQIGQTLTLDLTLSIQAAAETVTVSGQVSLVDTEKTEVSQVVSQSQKDNLPLAGRRWESFALLTPNITTDGGSGMV